MGNVSSKLLGIFCSKKVTKPVYTRKTEHWWRGWGWWGGGGVWEVKRVKQEYRRPQVSQPDDGTFTFCLFLSSIVLKSLYSSYNKKKKN